MNRLRPVLPAIIVGACAILVTWQVRTFVLGEEAAKLDAISSPAPNAMGDFGAQAATGGDPGSYEQAFSPAQNPAKSGSEDPDPDLVTQIRSFQESEADLSPGQQAAGWLALFDAESKRTADDTRKQFAAYRAVMDAIPAPDSWDAFTELVEQRVKAGDRSPQSSTLLLLGYVLAGEIPKEYALIRSQASGAGQEDVKRRRWVEMCTTIAKCNDDPRGMALALELSAHGSQLDVLPPLVPVFGETRAKQILERLVPEIEVEMGGSDEVETVQLAGQVALSEVKRLKNPQWPLAAKLLDPALTRALISRFRPPRKEDDDWDAYRDVLAGLEVSRVQAHDERAVAAELLLHHGEPLRALASETIWGPETSSFLDSPFEPLDSDDRNLALYRFLSDFLTAHPHLPLWFVYMQASDLTGHQQAMCDKVLSAMARHSIAPQDIQAIEAKLWHTLVGLGRVREGVRVLLECLHSPAYLKANIEEDAGYLSLHLEKIGALMGRPEWVREGRKGAESLQDEKLPTGRTSREIASRAFLLDDAQLWTNAAADYEAYLKLNPTALNAKLRLARLLEVTGKLALSAKYYEEAFSVIATRPTDSNLDIPEWFTAPTAVRTSVTVFKAAANRLPTRPEPHVWLAEIYRDASRIVEAEEECRVALRIDPTCKEAADQLAELQLNYPGLLPGEDVLYDAFAPNGPQNPTPRKDPLAVRDLKSYWKAKHAAGFSTFDAAKAVAATAALQHLAWNLATTN